MPRKFQRKIEDFVCDNCGEKTQGDGYTDHCLKCLWSKHVDINPGDRLCDCKGLMEPIGVEIKSKEYIIHYRCSRCKYRHKVKSNPDDNLEKIIELSQQIIN